MGCETRGVRVRILTNSLASTDVPVVHAGYRKRRVPLVQMGIELFEVKPELGAPKVGRVTIVREPIGQFSLHAKMFVFDRKRMFVGSSNFDMRSFHLNTEVGLIIDSPELAAPGGRALRGDHDSGEQLRGQARDELRRTGGALGQRGERTR